MKPKYGMMPYRESNEAQQLDPTVLRPAFRKDGAKQKQCKKMKIKIFLETGFGSLLSSNRELRSCANISIYISRHVALQRDLSATKV